MSFGMDNDGTGLDTLLDEILQGMHGSVVEPQMFPTSTNVHNNSFVNPNPHSVEVENFSYGFDNQGAQVTDGIPNFEYIGENAHISNDEIFQAAFNYSEQAYVAITEEDREAMFEDALSLVNESSDMNGNFGNEEPCNSLLVSEEPGNILGVGVVNPSEGESIEDDNKNAFGFDKVLNSENIIPTDFETIDTEMEFNLNDIIDYLHNESQENNSELSG